MNALAAFLTYAFVALCFAASFFYARAAWSDYCDLRDHKRDKEDSA